MMLKIPKKTDSIITIPWDLDFDIKTIFSLLLEVIVEKLLERSDTKICKIKFNIQRSTPRYRVKKLKSIWNEKKN